jgi:hypothetical protein
VELTRAWFQAVGGTDGNALAAALLRLPGRSVYAGGRGDIIEAAEFSEREAQTALRVAWNVDGDRAEPGSVARFLRGRGVDFPELVAAVERHPRAHVQVGADGHRTKLYAYPVPDPSLPLTLAHLCGVDLRPDTAFVCADLDPVPTLKQYAEYPDRDALVASGRLDAVPELKAVMTGLPPRLSTLSAAWVLTERGTGGAPDALTLHVGVHGAPASLADVAGPSLAARLADRFRLAARMGLRLHPTYVSFSPTGDGTRRTAYYRLTRDER